MLLFLIPFEGFHCRGLAPNCDLFLILLERGNLLIEIIHINDINKNQKKLKFMKNDV